VRDPERTRQVGEEDETRLQRRNEQRLTRGVVGRDVRRQLDDSPGNLVGRQIQVSDAWVGS